MISNYLDTDNDLEITRAPRLKKNKYMTTHKISELPEAEFTGDMIDNCFYAEGLGTNCVKSVSMKKIFDWIRQTAIDEGLTVKLLDERIFFIRGG